MNDDAKYSKGLLCKYYFVENGFFILLENPGGNCWYIMRSNHPHITLWALSNVKHSALK